MVRRENFTNVEDVQGRAGGDDERNSYYDGPRSPEYRATSRIIPEEAEIYFIIPYCSGGDLYKRAPYTEHHASRYIAQVCDAVAYMQVRGRAPRS